ncbi:DNA-directed DNA polymerase eta rad30 [Rhizopus stolonifer]|uniref:DNA polymerase eta n=1 Tax=Rhizopus stolonifer TaxID=4846 RepID=A0A367KV26_RHIST|nr:DNA-directed DNA polymerase eta rad30 [Rhizopus stolonifer]
MSTLINKVNYAARKSGIKRMTNVTEAKKLCPDIQLLHVATYDAYRNASREIFKIFHKHCDTIQKIGSDEGFMDVTKTINSRLIQRYIQCRPDLMDKLDHDVCGVEVDWDQLGITVESKEEERRLELSDERHWSETTWKDLQLALGAELATEIRKEVYDKLQYTCSAGIAHNKTLAKLCSSRHKPNKQTVLRDIARMDFMRDIPFQKIRNLGGKLGSEIGSDLEVLNANELWKYSAQDLQARFGPSTGLHVYNICRGIDFEEVTPSKAPKSLMASKSFRPAIVNAEEMHKWFSILAIELHNRIMRHHEDYGTWPKNISIRYASEYNRNYKSRTMSAFHKDELKTHEILAKKAAALFNSLNDAYPCIGFDLCAFGLTQDESAASQTINHFFTKSNMTSAHHANGKTTTEIIPTKKSSTIKKGLFSFGIEKKPKMDDVDTFVCDECKQRIQLSQKQEEKRQKRSLFFKPRTSP